jgi:hypothetical protein
MKLIFLALFSLVSIQIFSQKDSTKNIHQAKPQISKISIGVHCSNLIDHNKGSIELLNGYSETDLSGLNGEYTRIDLAYGISLGINLSEKNSLVLDINRGKITAQNQSQYLNTDIFFLNLNFRKYLSKYKDTDNPYTRFYLQLGIGAATYETNRFFILDNGLFSQTAGYCLSNSADIGFNININPKFVLSLSGGAFYNYSDGFDGYINQTTGDLVFRSCIGLHVNL